MALDINTHIQNTLAQLDRQGASKEEKTLVQEELTLLYQNQDQDFDGTLTLEEESPDSFEVSKQEHDQLLDAEAAILSPHGLWRTPSGEVKPIKTAKTSRPISLNAAKQYIITNRNAGFTALNQVLTTSYDFLSQISQDPHRLGIALVSLYVSNSEKFYENFKDILVRWGVPQDTADMTSHGYTVQLRRLCKNKAITTLQPSLQAFIDPTSTGSSVEKFVKALEGSEILGQRLSTVLTEQYTWTVLYADAESVMAPLIKESLKSMDAVRVAIHEKVMANPWALVAVFPKATEPSPFRDKLMANLLGIPEKYGRQAFKWVASAQKGALYPTTYKEYLSVPDLYERIKTLANFKSEYDDQEFDQMLTRSAKSLAIGVAIGVTVGVLTANPAAGAAAGTKATAIAGATSGAIVGASAGAVMGVELYADALDAAKAGRSLYAAGGKKMLSPQGLAHLEADVNAQAWQIPGQIMINGLTGGVGGYVGGQSLSLGAQFVTQFNIEGMGGTISWAVENSNRLSDMPAGEIALEAGSTYLMSGALGAGGYGAGRAIEHSGKYWEWYRFANYDPDFLDPRLAAADAYGPTPTMPSRSGNGTAATASVSPIISSHNPRYLPTHINASSANLYTSDGRINLGQVHAVYRSPDGRLLVIPHNVQLRFQELIALADHISAEIFGQGLTRQVAEGIDVVEDFLIPDLRKIIILKKTADSPTNRENVIETDGFMTNLSNGIKQKLQDPNYPFYFTSRNDDICFVMGERTYRAASYFDTPLHLMVQLSHDQQEAMAAASDPEMWIKHYLEQGNHLDLRTDWEVIASYISALIISNFWKRVEKQATSERLSRNFNAHQHPHPASYRFDPRALEYSSGDVTSMKALGNQWFSIHAVDPRESSLVQDAFYFLDQSSPSASPEAVAPQNMLLLPEAIFDRSYFVKDQLQNFFPSLSEQAITSEVLQTFEQILSFSDNNSHLGFQLRWITSLKTKNLSICDAQGNPIVENLNISITPSSSSRDVLMEFQRLLQKLKAYASTGQLGALFPDMTFNPENRSIFFEYDILQERLSRLSHHMPGLRWERVEGESDVYALTSNEGTIYQDIDGNKTPIRLVSRKPESWSETMGGIYNIQRFSDIRSLIFYLETCLLKYDPHYVPTTMIPASTIHP